MHRIVPDQKHIGPRVKQLVVLILTLAIARQIDPAYATPVAPVLLVNPTLKQCITVILADECRFCRPTEGWDISQTGQCPSGYEIRPYGKEPPLNCVEYPKNDWAACEWGRYPTITPEFSTVTGTPDLTATAQQITGYPLTPSAPPSTPPSTPASTRAVTTYSFDYLIISFCSIGFVLIVIISIMVRRKKISIKSESK